MAVSQDHFVGAAVGGVSGISATQMLADVLQQVFHQSAAQSEAGLIVLAVGMLVPVVRRFLPAPPPPTA